MNAPPLSQTQVQFPIIDELGDDFAILIADVNIEVHSLSSRRLQGLKALFEAKLKSKGVPIAIPSSADELWDFISQDCLLNHLNIEFARLVVRYLGKRDLKTQLQRYEENLRKKTNRLLTHCRENNITPRAPPGCCNMKITVDENPYRFSLHRILEFKDFFVHQMGMDMALFTGWSPGSIFLHFSILEGDMEAAVRQLYAHKLQLRAMQVVAIEVGDVIVYHDTPIAMSSKIDDLSVAMKTGGPIVSKVPAFGSAVSSRIDDLSVAMETGGPIVSKVPAFGSAVSSRIDDLSVAMETGGPIVSKVPAFGSAVSAVVENTLGFLGTIQEEVKNDPQVKTALRAVKSGVEIASCFLDKVVDIFYYCQSDAITAAIQGLSCSVPDLIPLRILMGLLGKSLAQAVTNYSQLEVACNAAIHTCSDKKLHAQIPRLGELLTRDIAIGTAAVTIGTAVVVAGLLTGGIGALVVGSLHVAAGAGLTYGALQPTETAFSRISGNFATLKTVASDFRGGVTHVHATVKETATQVGNIYGADKRSVKLMIDSLNHLKMVCAASYDNIARSKEDVRSKTRDLQAEI